MGIVWLGESKIAPLPAGEELLSIGIQAGGYIDTDLSFCPK
jgi:hypothetical protein